MNRGCLIAGGLFLILCALVGILTGVILSRLFASSPQEAIILLGVGGTPADPPSCRLYAVWVATLRVQPEPDLLELIGLPPSTWDGDARLEELHCRGDGARFEDAVAELLKDAGVDRVVGTIAFDITAIGDLFEAGVSVGHARQDRDGALAYLKSAADPLDALERQRRVLEGVIEAQPNSLSALVIEYGQINLPAGWQSDRWVGFSGEVRCWFPRHRLELFIASDGQPAYRLLPGVSE